MKGEALLLLAFVLAASATRKKIMLPVELVALARKTGFPDPEVAAAIAMAESGGNPEAVGDSGKSIGLWQIHLPSHPEFGFQDLKNPEVNARAAFAISRNGTDWTPWSVYKSGAYLKFLRRPSA